MEDPRADLGPVRSHAVAASLADRDQPCHACGHNLRGIEGVACPECGVIVPIPVSAPAPRLAPGSSAKLMWWRIANSFAAMMMILVVAAAWFRGGGSTLAGVRTLFEASCLLCAAIAAHGVRAARWRVVRTESLAGDLVVGVAGTVAVVAAVTLLFWR